MEQPIPLLDPVAPICRIETLSVERSLGFSPPSPVQHGEPDGDESRGQKTEDNGRGERLEMGERPSYQDST